MLELIILSLAAYRLTHLVVFDKVFYPIRKWFVVRSTGTFKGQPMMFYELQGGPVRQFIGQIMNCYWCAGIWVSAAVWGLNELVPGLTHSLYLILAIAAVQSLLESAWSKSIGLPPEMAPASMKDGEDSEMPDS